MNERDALVNEPVVTKRRRLSLIWAVPAIAIGIGAWLVYHTLEQRGPQIEIRFKHADGLDAGKTRLKYKNVEIGLVTNVRLSDDLTHIVASADLVKGSERFTQSDTKFWVVRPRIDRAGVSGLGTLVSGPYIAVDPGTDNSRARSFDGLDSPPTITGSLRGRRYYLEAERRGSLSLGSPVYLRDIRVGEVTRIDLMQDNERLQIEIFVNAPYHNSVYPTTRFWNASGVDLSINADGVDVQIASLESLISGGIAFETRDPTGETAPGDSRFRLLNSRNQIDELGITEKVRYVMYFDGSVRGLSPGAPVEFRGIKIGVVVSVSAVFDPRDRSVRIPVTIDIEPQRINRLLPDLQENQSGQRTLDSLLDLGLRAQLQTGSLLTGKLFVGLDFHPETEAHYVGANDKLPELPTIPTVLGQFEDAALSIMTKLQTMPVEQLSADLAAITAQTRKLLADPAISDTIRTTEHAVRRLEGLTDDIQQRLLPQVEKSAKSYDENSPFYRQLVSALADMQSAAVAIRALADEIERAPESILRGKR